MSNRDKGLLRAYFKDTVDKFEEYCNDPEQHHKIFEELGFTLVEDECDGFCPELVDKNCIRMNRETDMIRSKIFGDSSRMKLDSRFHGNDGTIPDKLE